MSDNNHYAMSDLSSRSNTSSPNQFRTPLKSHYQIGSIRANFESRLAESLNDAVGGYRSPLPQFPTGASPPIASSHGGRTVREYEEQISTLRKENFNLKLRLYFVEETTTSYHPKAQQNQQQHHQQQSRDCVNSIGDNCSHGNIMKQLIDAKVEREVLRKELQEKQDILKEAAQAMTQMENVQKDTETHYNGLLEELQQKIHNLEMERNVNNPKTIDEYNAVNNTDDVKENSDRGDNNTDLYTVHKVHELEGLLKQSEIKLVELQSQNLKLEATIQERNEAIVQYEEKVKELSFKITELLENMQKKNDELAEAEHLTRCERLKNNNLKAENENLITVLKETQKNFHKEMSNAKKYEHQVREQQETLNRIQSTISLKTANTICLLELIKQYDKMATKMKAECNIIPTENPFFQYLIEKLESSNKSLSSSLSTSTSTSNQQCGDISKEETSANKRTSGNKNNTTGKDNISGKTNKRCHNSCCNNSRGNFNDPDYCKKILEEFIQRFFLNKAKTSSSSNRKEKESDMNANEASGRIDANSADHTQSKHKCTKKCAKFKNTPTASSHDVSISFTPDCANATTSTTSVTTLFMNDYIQKSLKVKTPSQLSLLATEMPFRRFVKKSNSICGSSYSILRDMSDSKSPSTSRSLTVCNRRSHY